MKRILCLTLALLALTLSLTSCTLFKGNKSQPQKPMASESSQSTAGDKSDEEQKEEKVVRGTINKIDNYLVLLTEDDEYQIMDYGEGVTVDEFMEGDKVEVTYTGELGVDSSTPVIVSIAKVK